MDRRAFIAVLASGALGCGQKEEPKKTTEAPKPAPTAIDAQQVDSVRRIGLLTAGSVSRQVAPVSFDELRERGWVEGQNLVIERRGGDGNLDRVPALAAELVQLQLDVIVTFGAVAGVAMKNATTSIPIVATSGDPVRLGLVSSLSHPGANITGLSLIAPELAAKRLELIREFVPKATLIGELVDPANLYWRRVRPDYEQAFRGLRMQPIFVEVANADAIEEAIAQIASQRADEVIQRRGCLR